MKKQNINVKKKKMRFDHFEAIINFDALLTKFYYCKASFKLVSSFKIETRSVKNLKVIKLKN